MDQHEQDQFEGRADGGGTEEVYVDPETYYDDEALAGMPVWPKVIGIIHIVLGGLGLTCMGCGIVGFIFLSMAPQDQGPLPPTMTPGPAQYAMIGIGGLLAVFQICVGIVTIMRAPTARMLNLAYALIGVAMTIWSVAVLFQQMAQMQQWVNDNPDSMYAQSYTPVQFYIQVALSIVIGLAWPVFLLIWFGLIKKRPQDMTGGTMAPAA